MKKSLLALAVLGAFAGAATAQTNVTLTGILKTGLSYYDLDSVAGVGGGSSLSMNDGSSRIIIRGTEDLGGGLKGIFQVDNRLPMEQGTGGLAGGNTFIGLAGGFGQIRLGRLDQYYGLGTDQHGARATALNASSISILSYVGDASEAIANASRTQNLIRWDSPNWGGFTAGFGYSTGYAGDAVAVGDPSKGDAISVDLAYRNGPLMVGLGYWTAKNEAKTTEQEGIRLAGSYQFGIFSVGLTYDKSSRGPIGTGNLERDAWSIPLTAKLGPGLAMLTYSQAGDVDVQGFGKASDSGAKMWSIGYDYPLSKRTSLGISYAQIDNEANAAYALYTGSSLGQMPNPAFGQDVSRLYIGLRHTF
jgi:predicted porin